MTESRINQRQLELMWTRIGLLWGDRGDKLDAALRYRDLGELKDLLASLKVFQKTISELIPTIQDAITALEARAQDLETITATHGTELADHEARIAALEAIPPGGGGPFFSDGNAIETGEPVLIFDGGA